ncbi:hypothetical protein DFH09DRAFT_1483107, partial [Mycena vulgaris]
MRGRSDPSKASSKSNINDTIITVALTQSESRDRRVFAWTLQSLTDHNELLPFLEAIPEAIHGTRGFHLVNDHLFIPLLNGSPDNPSLGVRITELLISSRIRVPGDPLRQRGLIIAMKAVWALGMISGRTGVVFNHESGRLWFDIKMRYVITQPEKEIWRDSYALTARTACDYAGMNNLRNGITRLAQRITQNLADRMDLVDDVQNILRTFKLLGIESFCGALDSHLHSLKAWADDTRNLEGTSNLHALLKDMSTDDVWVEVNVTIISEFLIEAAHALSQGGDLPYEYLPTVFKMVPVVSYSALDTPRMDRASIFHPDARASFDPTQYILEAGEITGLDSIMRCFLRILPLLRAEDSIPLIAPYLANRNDLSA